MDEAKANQPEVQTPQGGLPNGVHPFGMSVEQRLEPPSYGRN